MVQIKSVGKAIAEKKLAQREMLWPGGNSWVWHRSANKGFATIPKTMPLILQIMDDLSKGRPVSSTYLGLWCDTWDNSMVTVTKPTDMALAAGFTGQRATYTWSTRIHLLQDLRFINFQAGKSGPISHVIIWNPHWVIRWHHAQKTPGLTEANFNALLDRGIEVGAKDMTEEIPVAPKLEVPIIQPPQTPATTSL